MNNYTRARVGVAGATGYAGVELLKRLARHPGADLRLAMGAGASEGRRVPALARIWDAPVIPFDLDRLAAETDVVFLAVPDTLAAEVAPTLTARGARVFDLSGAFRLRNDDERRKWYPHAPAVRVPVAYGLTERNRAAVREAQLIACPGCYPTAALLALQPLVDAELIEGAVIIDAKSGISGAGKTPSERTHFSEIHGSIAAYGVFAHRHAAEIEQELGMPVTFVPHLVPLDRGILSTIYAKLSAGASEADVATALDRAYAAAPFVRLFRDALPEIKHVAHTNFCDIGWRVDAASRRIVLVSCLDNLMKGAAGQAVQVFNVARGYDERTALA
jgi:N-acetyl-gamma-glutamyl-phosphate reductase